MKDRTRCATLLGGLALLVLASAFMSTWHAQARETSIDVAAWVARWPTRFDLSGGKSEPTYVEAINIDRRGNVFTAVGGAPAWEQRSVERVSIDSSGNVTHLVCPSGLNCDARARRELFVQRLAARGVSQTRFSRRRRIPGPGGAVALWRPSGCLHSSGTARRDRGRA